MPERDAKTNRHATRTQTTREKNKAFLHKTFTRLNFIVVLNKYNHHFPLNFIKFQLDFQSVNSSIIGDVVRFFVALFFFSCCCVGTEAGGGFFCRATSLPMLGFIIRFIIRFFYRRRRWRWFSFTLRTGSQIECGYLVYLQRTQRIGTH